MQSEGVYKKLLEPLATSRSGLAMLLSGDLGELNNEQQEYLQHILELDDYMISLVGSWMDMERLSKGQVVLDVEPCNIGSVLKAAAGEGVELHRGAQWPMVLADPLRLKQIVVHILDLFITVEVRARIYEDMCMVTFHDHTTRSAKQRAGIVEALHADVPTAQLGIRIARLLAEAHGGSLTLNPHATDGIRLHLKLPLAKQMSLLGEAA